MGASINWAGRLAGLAFENGGGGGGEETAGDVRDAGGQPEFRGGAGDGGSGGGGGVHERDLQRPAARPGARGLDAGDGGGSADGARPRCHTTLNVPFRFSQVLAKEAATLDLISGGRLDLCLGAGGEPNRHLYDSIGVPLAAAGDRLQDLRDAIAILRGLWTKDKFSYQGRAYHVEGAVGEPKPLQRPIPIWVGAQLPRLLRLAGQLVDGVIKNRGWGSVEELCDLNGQVDAAAVRAGREPRSIRRILNGGGYVAKDAADAAANRSQAAAGPGGAGGLVGTVPEILETIGAYHAVGVFGAEVIPEAAKLA